MLIKKSLNGFFLYEYIEESVSKALIWAMKIAFLILNFEKNDLKAFHINISIWHF